MDPSGCLSLLLACLSIIFWLAPLADSQRPSSLRLAVYPPYSIFLPREQVALTCNPPEGQLPLGFLFHVKKTDGEWATYANQADPSLTIIAKASETRRTFACSFWGNSREGKPFQSALSNEVVLNITEFPSAPALSLSPRRPLSLQGAALRMTCTAPAGQEVAGHRFFKIQDGQVFKEMPNDGTQSYEVFPVNESTAGNYTCSYWTWLSGRKIQSLPSEPVSVDLREPPPPAPTLSPDPQHPVYVQGETVTLICSAPEGQIVAGYAFYKAQKTQGSEELLISGTGCHEKITVSETTAGEYRCEYVALISGEEILSSRSNFISLTMTGLLHQPQVSVSPKQDIYFTGESVNLSCTAPEDRPVAKIRFFKDEGQLRVLHPSSHLVPFKITHTLRLLPQDGGKYSCVYHIVMFGREIASRESHAIWLSVMGASFHVTNPASSGPVQTTQRSASTERPTSPPRIFQSRPSQLAATTTLTRRPSQRHESTATFSGPSLSHEPDGTAVSTSSESTTRSKITSSLGSTSEPTPTDGLPPSLWVAIGCAGSGGGLLLMMVLICLYRRKCKENNRIVARSYWKSLEFHPSTKRKRGKNSTGISLQEKNPEPRRPVDENWGILPKRNTPMSKHGNTFKEVKDEDKNSRAEFECPVVDPTYTLRGFSCSTFAQEENRFIEEEMHIYSEPFL